MVVRILNMPWVLHHLRRKEQEEVEAFLLLPMVVAKQIFIPLEARQSLKSLRRELSTRVEKLANDNM